MQRQRHIDRDRDREKQRQRDGDFAKPNASSFHSTCTSKIVRLSLSPSLRNVHLREILSLVGGSLFSETSGGLCPVWRTLLSVEWLSPAGVEVLESQKRCQISFLSLYRSHLKFIRKKIYINSYIF